MKQTEANRTSLIYPNYFQYSNIVMASKLRKDLEEQVSCPICQELFKDPRLLPCLHTYCKQCLAELVRTAIRKGQISCPECRKIVQVFNTHLTVQWPWGSPFKSMQIDAFEKQNKIHTLISLDAHFKA